MKIFEMLTSSTPDVSSLSVDDLLEFYMYCIESDAPDSNFSFLVDLYTELPLAIVTSLQLSATSVYEEMYAQKTARVPGVNYLLLWLSLQYGTPFYIHGKYFMDGFGNYYGYCDITIMPARCLA